VTQANHPTQINILRILSRDLGSIVGSCDSSQPPNANQHPPYSLILTNNIYSRTLSYHEDGRDEVPQMAQGSPCLRVGSTFTQASELWSYPTRSTSPIALNFHSCANAASDVVVEPNCNHARTRPRETGKTRQPKIIFVAVPPQA